jgi:hypothetical protein
LTQEILSWRNIAISLKIPLSLYKVGGLRRDKRKKGGDEQRNDKYPRPAHVVEAKQPNIEVVDNEIPWHTNYERKDKTRHTIPHAWHGFPESEGQSH